MVRNRSKEANTNPNRDIPAWPNVHYDRCCSDLKILEDVRHLHVIDEHKEERVIVRVLLPPLRRSVREEWLDYLAWLTSRPRGRKKHYHCVQARSSRLGQGETKTTQKHVRQMCAAAGRKVQMDFTFCAARIGSSKERRAKPLDNHRNIKVQDTFYACRLCVGGCTFRLKGKC